MSTRTIERQGEPNLALRGSLRLLLVMGIALILGSCAALQNQEPIRVTVAGFEPLPGEGLEIRLLVKLRVQNPNDAPIDYDGVSLKLEVQGQTYASGVSDARGTIPRFGEGVIAVPMTISTLRAAFQVFGQMRDGKTPEKVKYRVKGKLGGSTFGSKSFETEGELDLSTIGQ